MPQDTRYHIMLLPRENYWGWVQAVRDYAVRFGVSITPNPEHAVTFHRPDQVITLVNFPGAYSSYGDDVLDWFRANAPGIELDVINVNSPTRLRDLLDQRIRSGLRFGVSPEPVEGEPEPFRLRWPTDYPVVTQPFGVNPDIYRRWGMPGHEGIDIRAPMNSNVYACADGEVFQVRDGSDGHPYGIHVRIRHRDGYRTVYAHLNRALVSTGQHVRAGDLIGLADDTGNSNGSHLHLTLKKDGEPAAGYPYDIIDPTPYLVWPEEEPVGPPAPQWAYDHCLVGLHGRADGPMAEADWQVVQTAKVEALKLTSTAAPEDVDRALRINPNTFIVVRLFADFRGRVVRAADFARWVEYDMGRFYQRGIRYYEVHNEVNLSPEGMGTSWRSGREFGEWFLEVVGLLKAQFPEALFGWPGLSPGHGVVGLRQNMWEFLESAGQIVDQADWLGCHCYWQDEAQMFSDEHGLGYRAFRERWPNKLLMITEFSNNSPRVDMSIKGTQYLKYYRHLRDQSGLAAAFAFVASASADFPHEVWRYEDGRTTPIPGLVGSRTF